LSDLILAVDRGTTNVKATLFDLALNQVAVVCHANPAVQSLHDLWAEADVEALWQAATSAVQKLWADGNDPARVRAVVMAGQGNGLFLIDGDGQPVRRGILSLDSRANSLVKQWQDDGRYAQAITRLSFPFGPSGQLSLLAWLAGNEPEVLARAQHALFSKDWIRYRLTGAVATDFTDASGAALLDHASQGYAENVFADFGISDSIRLLSVRFFGTLFELPLQGLEGPREHPLQHPGGDPSGKGNPRLEADGPAHPGNTVLF